MHFILNDVAYECRSADNHIYTLVETEKAHFILYIGEPSDQTRDESDITYDGRSITDIETNGGLAKQAEVTRLFRLMIQVPIKPITLAPGKTENCPFTYRYNLTP